jgi:hypothetical protein
MILGILIKLCLSVGDHELTSSNNPNHILPLLLDIFHLCIRIIHIFVFFNVSHMIFNHK